MKQETERNTNINGGWWGNAIPL